MKRAPRDGERLSQKVNGCFGEYETPRRKRAECGASYRSCQLGFEAKLVNSVTEQRRLHVTGGLQPALHLVEDVEDQGDIEGGRVNEFGRRLATGREGLRKPAGFRFVVCRAHTVEQGDALFAILERGSAAQHLIGERLPAHKLHTTCGAKRAGTHSLFAAMFASSLRSPFERRMCPTSGSPRRRSAAYERPFVELST